MVLLKILLNVGVGVRTMGEGDNYGSNGPAAVPPLAQRRGNFVTESFELRII